MFYIGDWNKQKIIDYYIQNNDVRKVLIIYPKRLYKEYSIQIPVEYIEIHETKKYENHYRLLQWVNKHTLIILDELLISQQRYSNEYNCISNFINQTPHRLVFNYLPFIDTSDDFMILLDFYNKVKYKGERFTYELFKDFTYFIKPIEINLNFINVEVSEEDKKKYIELRDKMFDEIGLKDPKNIPNNLALFSGDIKHKWHSQETLTSRNKRFSNLQTYKDNGLNTILDLPVNRKDLIELITLTKKTDIDILTSELSIDVWYKNDYLKWLERLKEFYDKADIFKHKCG